MARASSEHDQGTQGGQRILKKYPNRRLYDTKTSSYITLADVKKMVLGVEDFVVRDAKSGDDLTRSILLQIILEEESGGLPMFSAPALAQIIRFYGNSMQGLMGSYLEQYLQSFTDAQKRMTEQSPGLYDPGVLNPMNNLMGSYMEQSKKLFQQMQDQMTKSTETLFSGVPGFPPKR